MLKEKMLQEPMTVWESAIGPTEGYREMPNVDRERLLGDPGGRQIATGALEMEQVT